MRLSILSAVFSFALAGCAIHPLPGNYTGFNTIDITNHIRCEARDAIELKAIDLLAKSPSASANALAAYFRADRERFRDFKRAQLKDNKQKVFYDRYIGTAIAYDFTFQMAETNNASTRVDLVQGLTGGVFSLPLNASNERSRQNIRKFQIVETFGQLLGNKDLQCSAVPYGPNYVYPITGAIGLGEVVSTFIDLNETETLKPKDAKGPAMADELLFNTTFSGSVAPKIVLSSLTEPTGSRFRLAEATLNASASRADRHQLIIGLSVPPTEEKKPPAYAGVVGVGVVAKSVLSSRDVTPAGERATEAITQFRIDLFYDRVGPAALR